MSESGWCYLGEDGAFHLDPNCVVTQPVIISLPLGTVLALRCVICGSMIDYEKAYYAAKEKATWAAMVERESERSVSDV